MAFGIYNEQTQEPKNDIYYIKWVAEKIVSKDGNISAV